MTSSVKTHCADAMATVLHPDEVCAELIFPFFVISCLRNHKVENRYFVVDFGRVRVREFNTNDYQEN